VRRPSGRAWPARAGGDAWGTVAQVASTSTQRHIRWEGGCHGDAPQRSHAGGLCVTAMLVRDRPQQVLAGSPHESGHRSVACPCRYGRDRKGSRPISRVLSWTVIHLGRTSPYASCDLPGSPCGPQVTASMLRPGRTLPYLVLLRVGFTVPPRVATGAVRSYRTFSPLPPARRQARRFVFCGTFRGLAPPRRYLAPCPVEPGLSSPPSATTPCSQARLPGRLP